MATLMIPADVGSSKKLEEHTINSEDVLSRNELKEYKILCEGSKGFAKCVALFNKRKDAWETISLKFGAIGSEGGGKSSFVNTFLGLWTGTKGAADVSSVNKKPLIPKQYCHPNNKKLEFWDFPGVGPRKFLKETSKEACLAWIEADDTFDCFVIVGNDENNFTDIDVWLAQEIAKMGRLFYFVRTKIWTEIERDKRDKRDNHNEAEVLEKVRSCAKSRLKELGLQLESRVFLVANYERIRFEFDDLVHAIVSDLPTTLKRQAMIFSQFAVTESMVEMKFLKLRKRIWKVSYFASLGENRTNTQALSTAILISELEFYHRQLGLDDESFQRTVKLMRDEPDQGKELVSKEFPYGCGSEFVKVLRSAECDLMTFSTLVCAVSTQPVFPKIENPNAFALAQCTLESMLNKMRKTALIFARQYQRARYEFQMPKRNLGKE